MNFNLLSNHFLWHVALIETSLLLEWFIVLHNNLSLIWIWYFFKYLGIFISSKSYLKANICRIFRHHFTGKSAKQFYRFTGKFSVKANPSFVAMENCENFRPEKYYRRPKNICYLVVVNKLIRDIHKLKTKKDFS